MRGYSVLDLCVVRPLDSYDTQSSFDPSTLDTSAMSIKFRLLSKLNWKCKKKRPNNSAIHSRGESLLQWCHTHINPTKTYTNYCVAPEMIDEWR